MIPCELHNQIGNHVPYIHTKFTRPRQADDNKFIYLISDTHNGSVSGRYRDPNYQFWEWLTDVTIPARVVRAVKNKKCIILIDDTQEGHERSIIDIHIKLWCRANGFDQQDRDHIVYMTGNLNYHPTNTYTVISKPFIVDVCRYVWFDNWGGGIERIADKKRFTRICKERLLADWHYKFISLQQRPRRFRIELRDKLRSRYSDSESICTMKQGVASDDLSNASGIEVSPYDTNIDSEYGWPQITTEHFVHIPYAVVSETNFYGIEKKLVTEKAIKNLIYPQPFVLCGYQNQIEDLRQMGFQLYDDLVDHTYNTLPDTQRMDGLINELDRLTQLEPSDYTEQALHNRNIVSTSDCFGEVYTQLFKILFD